jgi:hypothetical protein
MKDSNSIQKIKYKGGMYMEQNKPQSAEEFARTEYGDDRPIEIFMERPIDMKHALWMMNIHAKRAVKYALEQAASVVESAEENNILSLEEQIIKDLKL